MRDKNLKTIRQLFHEGRTNPPSRMHEAIEIQAYAAKFGFDWATLPPIFEKLEEEIQELKLECDQMQRIDQGEQLQRIEDELGDVLFCCMNLARFLRVDPEKALESTNDKFHRRFAFIEEQVSMMGKRMEDLSLETLEDIWNQAKARGL